MFSQGFHLKEKGKIKKFEGDNIYKVLGNFRGALIDINFPSRLASFKRKRCFKYDVFKILDKPLKLNQINYKNLFDYLAYTMSNAALYNQLIKKAKMRKKKNIKLLRNLKTGLFFWRSKHKQIEKFYKNILLAKKNLSFEKKIGHLVNLYREKNFSERDLLKSPSLQQLSNFRAGCKANQYIRSFNFFGRPLGKKAFKGLKFELMKLKKKNKIGYLKNLRLMKLKKKAVEKLTLKIIYLKKKKRKNLSYKKRINKLHYRAFKPSLRKKRFKLINLIVKIKLKLLKIRKIFLLFIIQNLKNKFWLSFSILSKNNNFTNDMLVFLKKYMFLKKHILISEKATYKSIASYNVIKQKG
jgi:hypothetical protein